MTKQCTKCLNVKKLEDFHRSKNFKDGRTTYCKVCKSNICSEYYIENKDHCKASSNTYYSINKDKRNKWEQDKAKTDKLFKLKKRLRHRLRSAFYRLEKTKKSGSAIKDLGCSIEELKKHLESKFEPGMSWENWGVKGWHIDHIIPLSSAKGEEELIKLCHYTNLQPLWAEDNLKKGNRYID